MVVGETGPGPLSCVPAWNRVNISGMQPVQRWLIERPKGNYVKDDRTYTRSVCKRCGKGS